MAANWATSLTLSGREWMSSMKLTPATRVTAMRNQMLWKPKKAAQIQSPRTKIIPPPRSTILLCEERWFGLSMMLHLSAMRKYTNSAARSRAVIIKYVSQVVISVCIFVARSRICLYSLNSERVSPECRTGIVRNK